MNNFSVPERTYRVGQHKRTPANRKRTTANRSPREQTAIHDLLRRNTEASFPQKLSPLSTYRYTPKPYPRIRPSSATSPFSTCTPPAARPALLSLFSWCPWSSSPSAAPPSGSPPSSFSPPVNDRQRQGEPYQQNKKTSTRTLWTDHSAGAPIGRRGLQLAPSTTNERRNNGRGITGHGIDPGFVNWPSRHPCGVVKPARQRSRAATRSSTQITTFFTSWSRFATTLGAVHQFSCALGHEGNDFLTLSNLCTSSLYDASRFLSTFFSCFLFAAPVTWQRAAK